MNFLELDCLDKEQIFQIFNIAKNIKNEYNKNYLKGMTFVLFFPESSIRTRVTFEMALKNLGAEIILFPSTTLDKREETKDVIGYLKNWVNGIIVRHSDFNKIEEMNKYSGIPVINAMSSKNHPCEIMSDLFSLNELNKDFLELKYVFIGGKGNIAYSWMEAARILDLEFIHISENNEKMKDNDANYSFTTSLIDGIKNADVILTDPLPKHMRNKEYYNKYQLTKKHLEYCNKNIIVNPCPPFYRGEEIEASIIDSKAFVGYEFKKNLLYVQQAIILYCLNIL